MGLLRAIVWVVVLSNVAMLIGYCAWSEEHRARLAAEARLERLAH